MDIVFDKNSWHYKLNSHYFSNLNISLCLYFWKTGFSLLLTIAIGLLIIVGVIPFLLAPILQFQWAFFEGPIAWMSIIIWAILIALIVAALIEDQRKKPIEERSPWFNFIFKAGKYKKQVTDTLLVSWIKAKKQKICPKISWVIK